MQLKNYNNWPLEHWHIEISGKCTLRCPRCTRQEVPGYVNKELSLQWFKDNFVFMDKVKKITFCGDDGDPIYAKDLLLVIEWMKNKNPRVQIVMVTNGSYKTQEWWGKLNALLDENDNIHFSLDGWDQKSNELYRVNCHWESIITGIKQITNPYKTWAAIAFKFNESNIEQMKQMANTLGFDNFQLTLSTKFGKNYSAYPSDDPLQPSDEYVEGKFFPCCWTGLRYAHNEKLFEYINFSRPLPVVLEDQMWKKFQLDLLFNEGPKECFEKCSSAKWNMSHATQW